MESMTLDTLELDGIELLAVDGDEELVWGMASPRSALREGALASQVTSCDRGLRKRLRSAG